MVATALLPDQTSYSIHEDTQIDTSLGRVYIIEITKETEVVIAGPSKVLEMEDLVTRLKQYHLKHIFIDGALFRKTFANSRICDAIIVSTGASYSPDIQVVVTDTIALLHQFSLAKAKQSILDKIKGYTQSLLVYENSVLTLEDRAIGKGIERICHNINNEAKALYIHGALTNQLIDCLIQHKDSIHNLDLIVQDPTYIMCDQKHYKYLMKLSISLSVINEVQVPFVTCNPLSPYGYEFDPLEFKEELQKKANYPVVNILESKE